MDNPCGFVAFDVDPGQPGGTTSIAATYYAVNGPFGETLPVDKFTLTRPRRDQRAATVVAKHAVRHTAVI